MAITKDHHKLFVNLAAYEYTTIHKENLTAQPIINFQFITGTKVIVFFDNAKEKAK